MILKEKDIIEKIRIIAKQVEETSELKTELDPFRVELKSRFNMMKKEEGNFIERYACSYITFGSYIHGVENMLGDKFNNFIFPKRYNANEDHLNFCMRHEIMHNAQYINFPNFMKARSTYNEGTKYFKAYKKFIEGDATNIASILEKRYYSNPEGYLSKLIEMLIPNKKSKGSESAYRKGEEIIRNEFGNDRQKINALYELPKEGILEIFGD